MPFKEVVQLHSSEGTETDGLLDGLKKRLLDDERPLTGADLDVYVEKIVQELKRVSGNKENQGETSEELLERIIAKLENPEKPKFVLVDEFDDRALALALQNISIAEVQAATTAKGQADLKEEKGYDEELAHEHSVAASRVREALVEKLRQAITEEESLKDLKYSDLLFSKTSTQSKGTLINPNVKMVESLNSKELVSRNSDRAGISEEDKETYAQGKRIQVELPHHSNIVSFEGVGRKDIVGKLELSNVERELRTGEISPKDTLVAVRDCMRGALYYEQNGLVLEDISLDNCGVVRDEKGVKGILFDIDRVVPIGSKATTTSVSKIEYIVPGNFIVDGKASPLQMVFQFGRCLQKIQRNLVNKKGVSPETVLKIRELANYATEIEERPIPGKKTVEKIYPSLKKLEEEMNQLIADLESEEFFKDEDVIEIV